MKYNEIIKAVMEETDTKQRQLAAAMGVGQPAISNILNRDGINLGTMVELLEIMGYEVVVQKKTQGRRKEGQMVVTK